MLKKKLANLWYYYKYYFLAGVLALIVLGITVKSCASRHDFDVNLLFITHGYGDGTLNADELARALAPYLPDRNGDGVSDLQVITINYGNTLQESNSANAMRAANLAAGDNVLLLLDEQNYSELKAGGFLAPLSFAGAEGDAVDVTAMMPQLAAGRIYRLCLRVRDGQRAEKDKDYASRYRAAASVFENLNK